MNILVINCGSSSLKFQLIDSETEKVIAKGLCERIGIEGSKLNHTPQGGEKVVIEKNMNDHLDILATHKNQANLSNNNIMEILFFHVFSCH